MAGSLKYRVPGKEPVILYGEFSAISDLNNFEGFVVSNFDKTKMYGFVAGEETKAKYDFIAPYIYSHEEYICKVEACIEAISTGDLDKVIFSRIKQVEGDITHLFQELYSAYPKTFVYELDSQVLGHWIGATPELLLKEVENVQSLVALAGTKLSDDASEWGEKEKEEQRYVELFVEKVIADHHLTLESKSGPNDQLAGPVKHLCTNYQCSGSVDLCGFVNSLHPTPAVSGVPQKNAIDFIHSIEEHDRNLYAGIIGLIGKDEVNLFVNLRCMQVNENSAFLYVGGGITIDSDPELEWMETENKARTLQSMLKNS